MNAPKLRFPGFQGEWEKTKVGEICAVKTGSRDTQNKNESGIYPFFVRSDNVERINTYSYDGEAILTSGDGVGVGKNFHYITGRFDYHQRVYCLHNFIKSVSGKFIYFLFSDKFYKHVITLSAKNSVDSVRMAMITDLILSLPSLPEQQKIAEFLSSVDNVIQLLTKKKTLLENYKKGIMQKIFSLEIRFKDDDGNDFPEWEEKRLFDVSERIKRKNDQNCDRILTISARSGLVSQEDFFNSRVASRDLSGYYLLAKDDFAYNKSYSNGYPMGAIKRLKLYDKGVVSSLYICFRFSQHVLTDFMEQYFEAGLLNYGIESVAQEGARNHGLLNISIDDFFGILLLIPPLPEQQKIADFLSGIDRSIEIVNSQIEKAKEYKKGLLQQMFV